MRKLLAAAILVAGAVLAGAPALQAAQADATRCEGELIGAVVEDLVVPSGATCILGETEVTGDVEVETDASLRGDFATIHGDVALAAGAALILGDSAVGGDITCSGCRTVVLTFMFDPTGQIDSSGNVEISGMTDGNVGIDGWRMADLEVTRSTGEFTFIDVHVAGNLVFEGNSGNAGFFFTFVQGDMEVVGNTSAGGGFPADFTLMASSVGKDFVFSDNIGSSELTENVARKRLECFGNEPPPTGWGNRAGKAVEGQCAELTGPPPE
jgi:hypothetical protein